MLAVKWPERSWEKQDRHQIIRLIYKASGWKRVKNLSLRQRQNLERFHKRKNGMMCDMLPEELSSMKRKEPDSRKKHQSGWSHTTAVGNREAAVLADLCSLGRWWENRLKRGRVSKNRCREDWEGCSHSQTGPAAALWSKETAADLEGRGLGDEFALWPRELATGWGPLGCGVDASET